MECHKLTIIRPNMVAINGRYTFITYIAVFAKLKTWAEPLQSSYSKQWKKAIDIKYNNLVYNSIIKWVDKSSVDKYAITRNIIYKKKENENRDFTYVVARDFSQISSKDFIETFISVVKFAIFYIYLVLVVYLD